MESIDIISLIIMLFKKRQKQYNIGSFFSNSNGSSFYLTVRRENNVPVQIRLSNHGTYLKTWIDRTHLQNSRERLYDPSHCINISIVFIDDENDITKDCPNRKDCEDCPIQPCVPQTFEGQNELGHPFCVKQFCYKSSSIRRRYIKGIVKAIAEAIARGEYIDPLINISRAAKSKTLTSDNNIQEMITTERGSLTRTELKSIIKEAIADALDEVNERKQNESLKKKIKNVVRDTIGDMMRQSYKESYPELYADIQSGKRTNRGNGKYKDNLYFGWNMVEWNYKQTNTDKDTLEALHKSYDRYGEDCVKKGEEPCEAGFNAWCLERMSDFPNYY